MTILPGLDVFNRQAERADHIASMISDLIEQAHINYLKYLAAAATHDAEQVWLRYHESFALEQDIDTLATLYDSVNRKTARGAIAH